MSLYLFKKDHIIIISRSSDTNIQQKSLTYPLTLFHIFGNVLKIKIKTKFS